ncbi:peptide chain release factor N(5)-glutamine methyltransferase [Deferrisoma camini]|uniref:peptide chain release factor N(5)-glutamine methyltransferase n=1 Tax=Deferrisoma camini TaxID=1035120 RepID=UPI00046D5112|nr:peptide chain release factor N(5)-glutamine methyltransferase [Deferrisoma camini]
MTRTPLELVRLTAEYLAGRGVANPRLDAEVLLAHVLGVPRIRLYTEFDKPLEEAEVAAYREAVRRRARREPVAYITGEREFWSLRFRVAPGVLVPRPETELLVEAALEGTADTGRVLDLGTGSGCVVVAFLRERPGWTGVGVDASAEALEVARENAGSLGVADRLELRQGDLFGPVGGERFDRIVSNPPYVPTAELETLEPEVNRFEPRGALDGGPDGLAVIRRIAAAAAGFLAPGGRLVLEFGRGQERAVAAILEEAGFSQVEIRDDLAGIPRVAVALL